MNQPHNKLDIAELLANLNFNQFNAQFIDVRIERTQSSHVQFQNGELIGAGERPVLGAFIRLNHKGAWYYASTTAIHELETEIKKLATIAQSNTKVHAFKMPPNNGKSILLTKRELDLSKITLDKKVALCESYLPLLKKIANVKDSRIAYVDTYKEKYYRSSVGTEFAYDFNQAGLRFHCTLKKGEELFTDSFRSYVTSFDDLKNLESNILDYFEEAQKFLSAETITPGKYKVVMSPEITGVFTHESFGHKSEADFMMGDPEATREWKMGSIVGSPCLSIVDYGGHDHTSGWCPIDDEGTPAKKNYLIKNGVLTGRLHSAHTAHVLDEEATGNARALNFEYEPIVRMTSTYIEAGATPLKEILKMAEGGLYFDNFKHGSGGSTFTIAPLRAYRIKNGELAEPVRVSVMSGSVFETLKKIVACSDDFKLESSAFGGCGKMEQGPLPVADGGPSILVDEMQIS